ncbi:hypothetical protein M407DRAFT_22201 [Tulasnella calospora MUT 4182]|uniref:Uncharacterized protein n=1 Tax=Tulasnella calospora MUT 4182 TaxID=1051891 RepID=A0A0C3QCT5_9AGAM|nr:hypothetical protein M407DRAFT_22201 [Tulasnella calospora MUT 4182]
MAWYTDVMHEIKPIQSGYRLGLSYNLIHTTTSLRPALTDTSESMQRLREILLFWKQHLDDEESPDKIIYLLEHRYSHANYRGSALKGNDTQAVAILESHYLSFNALSREPPTVKAFIRELRVLTTEHPYLREELEPVITELITARIKSLQPRALQGQAVIMEWLEYCADNDNIDACSEVINQVIQDASSANGNRLTSEFLPLLPIILSWHSRRGKRHMDQPSPFLFRTVILRWLQTILGTTKLDDVAQSWPVSETAAVLACGPFMRWLADPSKEAMMSQGYIGAPNVYHIEKNLWEYVSKLVDWTGQRTSPHGIEIVKKDKIHKAQMWTTNQALGLAAVRASSPDESILLSVLGEETYKTVIQMPEVPYSNGDIGFAAAGTGTSGPSNPTQVVSEGASRPRGNSSAVQPPPKRRRVDENIPIIDLTTP